MMWMEDWVLWNSERASEEVVEVSWWELTMLFCVVMESSLRNREGERFSAADSAFVARPTRSPIVMDFYLQ